MTTVTEVIVAFQSLTFLPKGFLIGLGVSGLGIYLKYKQQWRE